MNKDRRGRIDKLIEQLESISEEMENIRDDERGAFDNMPESFQNGENGQAMESGIDNLENALSCLCDITEELESAKGES